MKKTGAVLFADGTVPGGELFKPMLPFGDSTVIRHMAGILKEAGADPVVVVTGDREKELREHFFRTGVMFVKNERFQKKQIMDSLRAGMEALRGSCSRIILLSADFPAVLPETVRQILAVDGALVRMTCKGRNGYPVMLDRETAERLCSFEDAGGIWETAEKSGIPVTNLETEDEGIFRGMDTREEYLDLLNWNYGRGQGYPLRAAVRVQMMAAEPFYGPGVQELLGWIGQTGSLQEACGRMGLSYSKGSKMVRRLERQLGFAVVERRAGGSGGGGSRLTERGRSLLKKYGDMAAEVQASADLIFQKYFGDGI
ncbi:MAG: NTP transferase domain-containing protein [Eubacteriales bacterium]|nr:NTP transferase domain-containing protein [Eubacteriales bacterium]